MWPEAEATTTQYGDRFRGAPVPPGTKLGGGFLPQPWSSEIRAAPVTPCEAPAYCRRRARVGRASRVCSPRSKIGVRLVANIVQRHGRQVVPVSHVLIIDRS
jgi:hypothetical protein